MFHKHMSSYSPVYTVNVEIFTFFAIWPISRKFPPWENKTHKTLLRKEVKYRENYPHVKGLANIFAKFYPSENNHVYSKFSGSVIY